MKLVVWSLWSLLLQAPVLFAVQLPDCNEKLDISSVKEIMPVTQDVKTLSSGLYELQGEHGHTLSYIARSCNLTTNVGYSGNVPVLVTFDSTLKIQSVYVLNNEETKAYMHQLDSLGYRTLWKGMSAFQASFMTVDAVSGATQSCHAILNAVQDVCKMVDEYFIVKQDKVKTKPFPVKLTVGLMICVVLLFLFLKKRS